MYRLSTILIILALILLVVSFVPWPSFAPAEGVTAAQGVEEQGSIAAGEPRMEPTAEAAPTVVDLAEHGRTLFMIKGCSSCHTYVPITEDKLSFGPNLTNYVPDPEFVRTWLRDPVAVRPEARMPDLDLSEEEIDALIAFLTLEE
jgi:cytochrome c2